VLLGLSYSHVSTNHTIIIGGGIVGVSTAYFLAKAGQDVTLIDREAFDRCASTGNAGIIALGHPPMPRPGMVRDTFKMLLDPLNPLYIPPRIDLELWKWMRQFRKACSHKQFNHSMQVLADLGWHAGRCFDELVECEQLNCEYSRTGWMEIFRSSQRMEQGLEEAAMLRTHGYAADEWTGEQLLEREPAFLPGVAGAIHYTDSRFANPQQCLEQLATRAAAHGATLHTNAEVTDIHHTGRRFTGVKLASGQTISGDTLVLAGGIWTTQLARQLGMNVPMQPGKGYHINISAADEDRPSTVCVLAETYVAVTPIGGGLRLAGTLEFSGINHRMVQKRIDMLRIGARKYLRHIDQAKTTSQWCGLRPCTADGLPVIGWAPEADNVFLATGHAMMGFALGPITGQLACEAITSGESSFDLTPLSPARYSRTATRRPHAHQAVATASS